MPALVSVERNIRIAAWEKWIGKRYFDKTLMSALVVLPANLDSQGLVF